MKHKGCRVSFANQRNRELMKAYREILSMKKHFDFRRDYEEIANQPCSRFWVSEERALAVVSAMLKGQYALDSMWPLRREMFIEIFKRVIAILEQEPDRPLSDVVFDVINSPAPKFYLEPRSVMNYICIIRNNNKKNRAHKVHGH